MKCSTRGCSGEYEERSIIQTIKCGDDIMVFVNVPANVCMSCGDTKINDSTLRRLEELYLDRTEPERMVPLYQYSMERAEKPKRIACR